MALADPVVDAAVEIERLAEVAVGVVEFEQPDVRGGETEVGVGLPSLVEQPSDGKQAGMLAQLVAVVTWLGVSQLL